MNEKRPFEMTISTSIFKDLGINLYSSTSAVLTEVIANAWDAYAKNIKIDIIRDERSGIPISLFIKDDGIGMTRDDLIDKYLKVGRNRREENHIDGKPEGIQPRLKMGRKGIGKLSLFAIADTIEVYSFKDDERNSFVMKSREIEESAKKNIPYKPQEIPFSEELNENGTIIILNNLKQERISKRSITYLKKRLSRRFSIFGDRYDFNIIIDNQKLSLEDRPDLKSLQFIWVFGNPELSSDILNNLKKEKKVLSNQIETDSGIIFEVDGWIGTVDKPSQLNSKETGNINDIVILSRGRLIQEDILEKITDGGVYTKYITGQIESKYFDEDDKPDIVTSNRQSIQEDDERTQALIDFIKKSLSQVSKDWTDYRKEIFIKEIGEISPPIKKWLETFKNSSQRKSAEKILSMIGNIFDKKNFTNQEKNIFYSHIILGFDRLKLTGSINLLEKNLEEESIEGLIQLFSTADDLEARLYHDIIKNRIEVVKAFSEIVNTDKILEKEVQNYLFEHLWLLDPSWERVPGSEILEAPINNKDGQFDKYLGISSQYRKYINDDESSDGIKGKNSRIDIAYRTTANKHLIIELKKPELVMDIFELQAQGRLYKQVLEYEHNIRSSDIEVIFIVGKRVIYGKDPKPTDETINQSLSSISGRILYYNHLVKSALASYSEYLAKDKESNEVMKIIKELEKSK